MTALPLTRLGQAIRSMRQHRGLTQQALAARAGVPRRKVIEGEQGSPRVAIETYARVVDAVGGELAVAPARRPTFEELKDIFPDED
ncbi:helix-turn-helix domain-containing protein [Dyella sp.]|uniref:helix-turn-helix domain-containing protein n=1 Tax=Dyella sp. TaxID=1869338 RepID=UPI002B4A6B8A|nr:helix-turn-helix domain-containing protein [Dyella sp.]HKT27983.1 helix-turn-helix domain-containing protein [Dyella sp.]